jgi:hypothetical protein
VWIGGKDAYAADRRAAEEVARHRPQVVAGARAAALAGALAPGSFVAISHLTSDFAPDAVASGVAAYNALVPAGITARTHAQVTDLFGGLPLVPPGIVPVAEWRPAHIGPPAHSTDVYAGLATTTRRPR